MMKPNAITVKLKSNLMKKKMKILRSSLTEAIFEMKIFWAPLMKKIQIAFSHKSKKNKSTTNLLKGPSNIQRWILQRKRCRFSKKRSVCFKLRIEGSKSSLAKPKLRPIPRPKSTTQSTSLSKWWRTSSLSRSRLHLDCGANLMTFEGIKTKSTKVMSRISLLESKLQALDTLSYLRPQASRSGMLTSRL